MRRINLEPRLWADLGFKKLIRVLGEEMAIGCWVRAACTAQDHWFPDCKNIPHEVWDLGDFNCELINCGLVKKEEDGYYLRGSEEQFEWLFEMQRKGKISAEKRKKRKLLKKQESVQQQLNNCSNLDSKSSTVEVPLALAPSLSTNTKQPTSSDCEDDYSSSARKALANKVCKSNDPACRPLVQKFFEIYYPTKDIYTKTVDKYNPVMSEFIHSNNISYETMSAAIDNKLKVQLLDKDIVFEAHQRQVNLKSFLDSFLKYHPDHFKIENFYDGKKQKALEDDKYVNIVNNLFAEEDKKRGVSK